MQQHVGERVVLPGVRAQGRRLESPRERRASLQRAKHVDTASVAQGALDLFPAIRVAILCVVHMPLGAHVQKLQQMLNVL